MSDTPETDKAENDWSESADRTSGREVMADIARKLERERDEARVIADTATQAVDAYIQYWRAGFGSESDIEMLMGRCELKLPWE